jgi:O-glycosyl hydrolase
VHGEYYTMPDPVFADTTLVFMTIETWRNYGTQMMQFRQTAKRQDDRIKELLATVAGYDARCSEMESRMENLRNVRRAEKRAELEQGLVLPGDTRFNKGK